MVFETPLTIATRTRYWFALLQLVVARAAETCYPTLHGDLPSLMFLTDVVLFVTVSPSRIFTYTLTDMVS